MIIRVSADEENFGIFKNGQSKDFDDQLQILDEIFGIHKNAVEAEQN